jgi:thiamine biosynthesis lipoprotein
MQQSTTFRAMNTGVDVIVEVEGMPPIDLFISLKLLFEEQEQRFSRFRETSLLSALNRGERVTDARLVDACGMALVAHHVTGGLYNPMVLPALRDAGYDRTFDDVSGGAPRAQAVPDPWECIVIDGDDVSLRDGQLDLGGIVKGQTVDLGIEAHQARYPDLFINAGGDLRGEGNEAGQEGWVVEVDRPGGGPSCWDGTIRGAMATSTTAKRRWRTANGGVAHHLIDPRTGLPAESPFAQVTVWAPETSTAEIWAKAVLVGGAEGLERCVKAGFRAMTVDAAGKVTVHLPSGR